MPAPAAAAIVEPVATRRTSGIVWVARAAAAAGPLAAILLHQLVLVPLLASRFAFATLTLGLPRPESGCGRPTGRV